MPQSLRTFFNRCRCCLEKFYDDERTSQITSFFESQFRSFTSMELSSSDRMSRHVCEYCHSELLRFSFFKKDLIEKQQKLNELLRAHDERKKMPKTKTDSDDQTVKVIEISDEEIEDDSFSESSEVVSDVLEDEDFDEDESLISNFSEDGEEDFKIVAVRKLSLKSTPVTQPRKKKKFVPPARRPQDEAQYKFHCDYCEASFKAKQGVARHVQSHIAYSTPWPCDEKPCQLAFSSKVKLNLHKLEAHDIALPLQNNSEKKSRIAIATPPPVVSEHLCFCGASFFTLFSLRAHKNRLHGRKNKCQFGCVDVQFVEHSDYLQHLKDEHPLMSHVEEVPAVEEKKKTARDTKPDKLRVQKKPRQKYECDGCGSRIVNKSALKSHVESHIPYIHREKFECELCKKLFTRQKSVRNHMQTVHHNKVRKYECSKCLMNFTKLEQLNQHNSATHDRNLPFRCNLCRRRYLKRYLLNRHLRITHKLDPRQSKHPSKLKIERKFKCFCGLSFPYKSRLLKHQEKHDEVSDTKKFKCPVAECVHSFKARSNLIRHQKEKGHIKHEDCYKYTCKCGIQFNSVRGFTNHKLKMKCAKKKAAVPKP